MRECRGAIRGTTISPCPGQRPVGIGPAPEALAVAAISNGASPPEGRLFVLSKPRHDQPWGGSSSTGDYDRSEASLRRALPTRPGHARFGPGRRAPGDDPRRPRSGMRPGPVTAASGCGRRRGHPGSKREASRCTLRAAAGRRTMTRRFMPAAGKGLSRPAARSRRSVPHRAHWLHGPLPHEDERSSVMASPKPTPRLSSPALADTVKGLKR